MKKLLIFLFALGTLVFSCKKDRKEDPIPEQPVPQPSQTQYTSLSDFYKQCEVKLQTYTLSSLVDGHFISPQSTAVFVPGNAFYSENGVVTIEFKDIYKKSDMLLSNMPTQSSLGSPIKSAGEFFMRALDGNMNAISLLPTKEPLIVLQPFVQPLDTGMQAFMILNNNNKLGGWDTTSNGSVSANATNYIFSLYSFSSPISNGTWCNSDNSQFFSSFPQTTITIHPNQVGYSPDVFLIFKTVNSMVHVYAIGSDFVYEFAPAGLECTVVAVGVKDGKLYSSFTPITISANKKMSFDMAETTKEIFISTLKALD